jgi:hypothetical protein|tara:strand:- start:527 stop:682 length:156 start_codon:yes stop_codon:yes gene_type:complete
MNHSPHELPFAIRLIGSSGASGREKRFGEGGGVWKQLWSRQFGVMKESFQV